MKDLERVTRGIECCKRGFCFACSYNDGIDESVGCKHALADDTLKLLKGFDHPSFEGTNLDPDAYVRIGDIMDCLNELAVSDDVSFMTVGLITWAMGKRSITKRELREYWDRQDEEAILDD